MAILKKNSTLEVTFELPPDLQGQAGGQGGAEAEAKTEVAEGASGLAAEGGGADGRELPRPAANSAI